jgi:outer membrane receptor protein involved in Fe transport
MSISGLKRASARGLILCLWLAGTLRAGTTGKISGMVRDAQTSERLFGASDLEGGYAILNLHPGIYTLRFRMMGYREVLVSNVRVSVDLTTRIDARMNSAMVETGEAVTVVANRPLVQPDMTSSLSTVGADEIENLPVQNLEDVLALQAGIVKEGGNIHIRGGRAGEVAFWVDGVGVTDMYNGGSGITVENNAIQELQVVSGTFNAEYGQAMSGIVNMVTKEGGGEFKAEFSGILGDYVSSASPFALLKRVSVVTDAVTGLSRAVGEYENPLNRLNPTTNAEFTLSGPVPVFRDRLSFFTSGRFVRETGYLYGREWFTPQGLPGDSGLVPMNGTRRLALQGKLSARISGNLKLNVGAFYNDWTNPRSFQHDFRYAPMGIARNLGRNLTRTLSLNHVLSARTFHELKINRNEQETESYAYEDPSAAPNYLVSVPADTARGIFEPYTFDPGNEAGAAELARLTAARVPFDYVVDPSNAEGYIHPDVQTAPTSYSFRDNGMDMDHLTRNSRYWVFKWDLTSQVNPLHLLKTGLEYRIHDLDYEQFTLRPKTLGGEEVVPFQPAIMDVSTTYHDRYTRRPREFSAYLQDKIEMNELIVNIGLRFDYFDPNTVVLADPTDPDIYYPYRNEHRYRGWVDPPDTLTFQQLQDYIRGFSEYTPQERRAFMHRKTRAKTQVSPRLGVSFPITDRGVIHFSYGHFFQIPEFQYLYQSPDFKLGASAGRFLFGNPDLKAQRTVMYEIGLQQQLTATVGVDVSAFYRDVRDWVGTSPMIQTYLPSVLYSQYTNRDYSNVYGVTFKLQKRFADHFSANLDYSYQIAEGTYSNPVDAFNELQSNQEPRLNLIPLDWDQRHTLNVRAVSKLAGWTCALIGQLWSGRPYTPAFPTGESRGEAAYSGLRENMSRRPAWKTVDLTLSRRFPLGSLYADVFLNVFNLFDIENQLNVYSDTGTAGYTTTIRPDRIPYDPLRIGTAEELANQPSWYGAPRQIQAGVSVGF